MTPIRAISNAINVLAEIKYGRAEVSRLRLTDCIDELTNTRTDLEEAVEPAPSCERRDRIATAALAGLLANEGGYISSGPEMAVQLADRLITELDRKGA